MANYLLNLSRQQFAFFVCCGMIVALVYSKFALTIGMILLGLASLVNLVKEEGFMLHLNPEIKNNFRKLWLQKDFLVITLFFFIVLFSGIYSSDYNYLGERLRIKLPFLLLPFAFVSIPPFSKKQYQSLFYLLIIVVAFSAIPIVWDYLINYKTITESLSKGKSIPTPINHIRYSLLLALSILSGITLWWSGFFLKYKWERLLIGGLAVFLFGFIHLLSVRSGLVVLYISILFLSLRFMIMSNGI